MLPDLPAVMLTPRGADRVGHGQDIRPSDQLSAVGLSHQPASAPSALSPQPFVRLLDARGELVAIAEPTRARRFCIPRLFWCNMLILLD